MEMEQAHPYGNFQSGFNTSHLLQLLTNRLFRVNNKQPLLAWKVSVESDNLIICHRICYASTHCYFLKKLPGCNSSRKWNNYLSICQLISLKWIKIIIMLNSSVIERRFLTDCSCGSIPSTSEPGECKDGLEPVFKESYLCSGKGST